MKVEFFSAGCRLCEKTLKAIREEFPHLEMEIHLASECVDGRCCKLAQEYGIRAVPSLVVEGNVVITGVPDKTSFQNLTRALGT